MLSAAAHPLIGIDSKIHFGIPVILHDAESKGAVSYRNLARKIVEKNNVEASPEAAEDELV